MKDLRLDEAAPWKQRFRAPTVLWTEFALKAPTHGLAASNQTGVYQLYAWDVPTGKLRQLTDRPEGQVLGSLSPDGRHIYYLMDKLGNEIGHYGRMPFEGGEMQDISPTLPPYSPAGLSISQTCNLIGLTAAGPEGFQIYVIEDTEGKLGTPRLVYQSKALSYGPAFSHDGEMTVIMTSERAKKPQFSLLAFDTPTGSQIAELWDGPETSIELLSVSLVPGDFRVLGTSDRSGFKRPLLWSPRSGERLDLAIGDLEGDVKPMDWSPDGKRILLLQFTHAVQQLYIFDLTDNSVRKLNHPGGEYFAMYFAPNGEIFAHWADSTRPTRLIALNDNTGEQTRTVLAGSDVPPGHSWRSFAFKSPDGQEIQGWVATPEGVGPFPTILETHGGPTAVQTETFSPKSQAWLDHGFAYATINYRGSTSFGKTFQEKILGDLGHWEVEDMVGARAWLIREGISIPDSILLTGWSYGGYLTLQALGKYPDLWAGGMAGVAIADWAIQYEDTADLLRGYQVALFGGTPQEQPERYRASSPITYAENVKAPVLIIQGRNDTRTPARPVEMYEAKMKALGKPIEIHWFETGHLGSFANVELGIDHQERMLRFAYRVLG